MIGTQGILDVMLGASSWDNPGYLSSKPFTAFSALSSEQSSNNTDTGGFGAESYFYNDSMLDLLHGWELTQSILDLLETTIADTFQNAQTLINTGNSAYDAEANNFMKELDLTQNIIDNLKDDMYYGQRAFWVDFESKSIVDIQNNRNFIVVKNLNKPFKIQVNDENEKEQLLDYNKLSYIMFNPIRIESKKSSKLRLTKDDEINNLLLDLTYHKGNSVLKGILYLIFINFLKSLLQMLLTLKNTTRPDLLQANIQPGTQPEGNIVQALNDVESLLNQGEYSFDFRSFNSYAIIGTLYTSLLNSVKVVPGLSNYTNFEIIQQPDLAAKIEQLKNDADAAKTAAINSIGIPEDLFGGSSNRWELINRSSRFASFIGKLINRVVFTHKLVAFNFLHYKHPDTKISLNDITINLGESNYLLQSTEVNKIQIITDRISKLSDAINAINSFKDLEMINKIKAYEYLKNNISSTDKGLSSILDFSIKDNNDSDESSEELI